MSTDDKAHPADPDLSPGEAQPRSLSPFHISGGLYLAAAAGLIAGSLLPWITVNTVLGEVSRRGTDTDQGMWTLVIGVVVGATGLQILSGRAMNTWVARIEAAVATGIVLTFWGDVRDEIDVAARDLVAAKYGIGLWVLGIAIVVLWGAVVRTPR